MSMPQFPLPQALLELVSALHDQLDLRSSMEFPDDSPPRRMTARRRIRPSEAVSGELPEARPALEDELYRVRSLLAVMQIPGTRDLTDDDLGMLALLFAAFLEGDGSQKVLCVVRAIRPAGAERLGLLARIQCLQERKLLCLDESQRPPRLGSPLASGRLELANDRVELHPAFLRRLLEPDGEPEEAPAEPPAVDYGRFLTDLLAYSHVLRSSVEEGGSEPDLRRTREQAWAALEEQAARSGQPIPFLELVRRRGLDARERDALAYLLDERLKGLDCTTDELCHMVGTGPLERMRARRLFLPDSRLVKQRIVSLGGRNLFGRMRGQVVLTDQALDEILGQEAGGLKENPLDLPGNGPLQERPIVRGWDHLVLPARQLGELESVLQRFESGARRVLQEWGVLPGDTAGPVSGHLPAPAGLRLLFSGPSGTGKTLCAEAMAQRLGRRLLVTDMSRLLSKWVGESQQNVSALFDDYTRIVADTPLAPVLLLDECDQFLLLRGHPDTGSEQMRHEMSNLFLERLDRVPGIVVATTNLVDVLDGAYSRRFDLKLVIPQPGPAERERIWRAHLPSSVPLLEPLPFGELAARFPFNGGRISLVMGNALARAAARGDGLAPADVLEAAHREQAGAFDGSAREDRWGFRTGNGSARDPRPA